METQDSEDSVPLVRGSVMKAWAEHTSLQMHCDHCPHGSLKIQGPREQAGGKTSNSDWSREVSEGKGGFLADLPCGTKKGYLFTGGNVNGEEVLIRERQTRERDLRERCQKKEWIFCSRTRRHKSDATCRDYPVRGLITKRPWGFTFASIAWDKTLINYSLFWIIWILSFAKWRRDREGF